MSVEKGPVEKLLNSIPIDTLVDIKTTCHLMEQTWRGTVKSKELCSKHTGKLFFLDEQNRMEWMWVENPTFSRKRKIVIGYKVVDKSYDTTASKG